MAELRRTMGLAPATAMVAGIIIGASIFVQPSEITQRMPSVAGIVGAWIGAGVLTLLGALVCAELASAVPRTGGVYAFLREVLAAGRLPGAGRYPGSCTRASSRHRDGVRALRRPVRRPRHDGERAVAAGLILLLTLVNLLGVRQGARVQTIVTAAKIAAIAAIVVAGALWSGAPPVVPGAAPVPVTAEGFALAMAAGLFAYGGWHMVTYTAGETVDPARTIPRALVLGIVIVTACYAGLNAIYLRVLPLDVVRHSTKVAADAADALLGGGGGALMAGLVLVSTFGAVNGIILAGPRVYLAMARDGLLFRWAGDIHPRFGTPHRALLLQGAWAAVLAATNSYGALFSRVIYTEWIFFAAMAAGLLVLRRRPGYAPAWRVPGGAAVPAAFIAVSLAIVVMQVRAVPLDSALGLGLVLLGVPVYRLTTGRASRPGPKSPAAPPAII
ncbi:MAG: amino acid permease [Vicinamibacterales bacterium]